MAALDIDRLAVRRVGALSAVCGAALTLTGCYLAHARDASDPGDTHSPDGDGGAGPGASRCRLAPIAARGWPMWGASADRAHQTAERAPTSAASVAYDVDVGLEFAVDLVADPEGRVDLPIAEDMLALAPDGTVAWRTSLSGRPARAPVVLGDGTLLATVGARAVVLSRADGSIVRTIALPGATYDPLVLDGDLVVHLAHPARVARVGCDGTVVYEVTAGAGDIPAAPIALDRSGRAHLAASAAGDAYRTVLLAVEADGSVAYRLELDGYLTGGPAIAPSGAVYLMLGRGLALDAHFVEIDRGGELTRDIDLGEQAFTAPTPLAIDRDGRAIVRTWESLIVVAPGEGRTARLFNHPNLVYAIAVDVDRRILRTSGNFQVLDPATLALTAQIDPPAPLFCVGGTAFSPDHLFATACNGHVVAIGRGP